MQWFVAMLTQLYSKTVVKSYDKVCFFLENFILVLVMYFLFFFFLKSSQAIFNTNRKYVYGLLWRYFVSIKRSSQDSSSNTSPLKQSFFFNVLSLGSLKNAVWSRSCSCILWTIKPLWYYQICGLASLVGITERKMGVCKLGWHRNSTGFDRKNICFFSYFV